MAIQDIDEAWRRVGQAADAYISGNNPGRVGLIFQKAIFVPFNAAFRSGINVIPAPFVIDALQNSVGFNGAPNTIKRVEYQSWLLNELEKACTHAKRTANAEWSSVSEADIPPVSQFYSFINDYCTWVLDAITYIREHS